MPNHRKEEFIMSSAAPAGNRIIFLDNLRLFLVLCVVVEHSTNAYSGLSWWPAADTSSSVLVNRLGAFTDTFAMPLLFYIAGYFAVPVIAKKGVGVFLKGKLKRLGIPWLICIVTICPIMPLIYHYTRDNFTLSMGYWDLWLDVMKHGAEFNTRLIFSMNELMQNNQFYQRYMWFLSLLLAFFFIFSAIYSVKKSWFISSDRPAAPVTPSVRSTLAMFGIVGGLSVITSFAMVGLAFFVDPELSNPEPLFTLGNVVQFRPSRIFPFMIYFVLGILTFKNKWIERGRFPGHLPTWLISFAVTLIAFFYSLNLMQNGSEELKDLAPPLYFFFLNFLTISTLGLFSSLALKYWNRPTAVNRNLSSNSYNIYLAHYPFVIALQLILLKISELSSLLKFGIVFVLSIFCTYIVCQYMIKPYPRLSAVLALCLFVAMVLIIHP